MCEAGEGTGGDVHGDADNGGVCDARVLEQQCLEFRGGHLVALDFDEFLRGTARELAVPRAMALGRKGGETHL